MMFFQQRKRLVFDLQKIQVFKLLDIKPILAPHYERLFIYKIYFKVKLYMENKVNYFLEYDSANILQQKCF